MGGDPRRGDSLDLLWGVRGGGAQAREWCQMEEEADEGHKERREGSQLACSLHTLLSLRFCLLEENVASRGHLCGPAPPGAHPGLAPRPS